MALVPGSRLGPYQILAAIGAGGMGEIYRARDTRLNRDVAIKVIAAGLADSPDAWIDVTHLHERHTATAVNQLTSATLDGERLLMVERTAPPPPITLVLNWAGPHR